MPMKNFLRTCAKSIVGAISGWDRIRFRGTIGWLANTAGINSYFFTRNILLRDFGKWGESITAKVRSQCNEQAQQLDIPMIYLPLAAIDKEIHARQIMAELKVETGPICMSVYGSQEGAEVGYNPHKPGRPSFCYHTYILVSARLVMNVDMLPGNQTTGCYPLSGLWHILDGLPDRRSLEHVEPL